MVIEHNYYDLFKANNDPSPIRWFMENAEMLPDRLLRMVQSREKPLPMSPKDSPKTGFTRNGETIHLDSIKWMGPADMVGALRDEKDLTRDLAVTFSINPGNGPKETITLKIPGLPFPTTWGTYVVGANQTILSNKLEQKPGIFPVNLDERAHPSSDNNGVLFHTPFASLLQTKNHITAIGRSLISSARNQGCQNIPVTIPRAAWPDLDKAINKASQTSDQLLPRDFPRLHDAFAKSMRLNQDWKTTANLFDMWVRQISGMEMEKGNWQERWQTLGYPEFSGTNRWNLQAANQIDKVIESLPDDKFISFSSLARTKVQTASNLITEMIAQKILWILVDDANPSRNRNENGVDSKLSAKEFLRSNWQRTQWRVTNDLIAATENGTNRQNKSLANEKNPAETAARVLLVLHEGHIFGLPQTDVSDAQRIIDIPSTQYFISGMTMEAQAGYALHLLPKTQVDPSTGELYAPFLIRDNDGNLVSKLLNHEQLETHISRCESLDLGIAHGKPEDLPSDRVKMHRDGKLVAVSASDKVPIYFDVTASETLGNLLRLVPGNEKVEVTRHAMGYAFINGASSCNGSMPDPEYDPNAAEVCRYMANAGKSIVSPIDGTITSIRDVGRSAVVEIAGTDGNTHKIEYPTDIGNAFGNSIGITCPKFPGEKVSKDEYLLVPDVLAVLNTARGQKPGIFLPVPLKSVEFPLGNEDCLIVSDGVVASGKFTVPKIVNSCRLHAAEGNIRIEVARPGTAILPGMLLARQEVRNADGTKQWRDIRAGESDRGILTNIHFTKNDRSRAGAVSFGDRSQVQPDVVRQTQDVLAGVQADFERIAAGWRSEVVEHFTKQDADANPRWYFELANYHVYDPQAGKEGAWIPRQITLDDLSRGNASPAYQQLVQDLQMPTTWVSFGTAGSMLPMEERLLYTHRIVEFTQQKLQREITSKSVPDNVGDVVFAIRKELPLGPGDKITALGSKGSINIVHPQELPLSIENGRITAPEIAYTLLGFFARSSFGDMVVPSEGQTAKNAKGCFWDPRLNSLVNGEYAYGTFRGLRQGDKNPEAAAASTGLPSRQVTLGQNNPGHSIDGIARSGVSPGRPGPTHVADALPAIESATSGNWIDRPLMLTNAKLAAAAVANTYPTALVTSPRINPNAGPSPSMEM